MHAGRLDAKAGKNIGAPKLKLQNPKKNEKIIFWNQEMLFYYCIPGSLLPRARWFPGSLRPWGPVAYSAIFTVYECINKALDTIRSEESRVRGVIEDDDIKNKYKPNEYNPIRTLVFIRKWGQQ